MKVKTLALGVLGWLSVGWLPAGEFVDTDVDPVFEEESGLFSSWSFRTRFDAESSVLWADGIVLSEHALGGRITSDPFDVGLTVGYSTFDLDYEPSIFGADTTLTEDRTTYALDGRVTLASQWDLVGSVAYYDGFSDYRSLWISEYYNQLFGGVPSFVDPAPKGVSYTLGLEWEYIPIMAKVRLTGGYGKDTIAPAYDIGENGLERSRPDLYTKLLQLQTENVLSSRVVVQNTFQYTDTTNREKRWTAQTGWNIALADALYLRLLGGYAVEQPSFEAYHIGGTLEYQVADEWFVRVNARYYEDTGEIENSLGGFTSSAPGLESFEFGAGLRWQGVHSALNLYAGYYQTNYDALAEDNLFLQNLYADRRWGLVQLSYTYSF